MYSRAACIWASTIVVPTIFMSVVEYVMSDTLRNVQRSLWTLWWLSWVVYFYELEVDGYMLLKSCHVLNIKFRFCTGTVFVLLYVIMYLFFQHLQHVCSLFWDLRAWFMNLIRTSTIVQQSSWQKKDFTVSTIGLTTEHGILLGEL